MKKIIALIISVTILCSALSARNFFSGRFFEIKTGAQLGVSNNLITGNDIFQKELVIDLRKLADDCPDSGMDFITSVNPTLEVNLNIVNFHLGVQNGIDMYGKFNIGKGLFNFAGYGNQIGETLNMNFTADADIFAYSQIDVGLDLKKFKLHVKPAVFVPVISTRGNGGTLTFTNDELGNIHAEANVNMDVYAPVDLMNTKDITNQIMADGNIMNSPLLTGYGFDLGGYLALPFSKSFSIDFDFRIPILPGRITKRATLSAKYSYDASVSDISNGKFEQEQPKFSAFEDADYMIYRPLKASVYADKNLLGTLFNARAGGGIGIQNPYTEKAELYPEYYLGLTFNLIDFFKLGVSTQYRDRVFIHQLGTTVSIRFVQVDVGVSAQSSDFKKSMEVAGVGAYAYVTVGF